MNYIEQELKKIEEKKNHLQSVELILKDLIIQNQIRQIYIDYLFDNDYFPIANYETKRLCKVSYIDYINEKIVNFSSLYINRIKEYKYLIDLCNDIGYDNDIRYTKEWAFKKDDWTFKIEETYSAKIPKEELDLLESLGKIKVEYISASKESRIFCSN